METHDTKTSPDLAEMLENGVKTLHDLADMLENAAKVLRAFPELQLSEISQTLSKAEAPKRYTEKENKRSTQVRLLEDLADRLPTLGKDNAEAEMKTLTVESIRRLASLLEIRVPTKATKSESINILLAQVFDIPAGQELIRTFHRRNSSS